MVDGSQTAASERCAGALIGSLSMACTAHIQLIDQEEPAETADPEILLISNSSVDLGVWGCGQSAIVQSREQNRDAACRTSLASSRVIRVLFCIFSCSSV